MASRATASSCRLPWARWSLNRSRASRPLRGLALPSGRLASRLNTAWLPCRRPRGAQPQGQDPLRISLHVGVWRKKGPMRGGATMEARERWCVVFGGTWVVGVAWVSWKGERPSRRGNQCGHPAGTAGVCECVAWVGCGSKQEKVGGEGGRREAVPKGKPVWASGWDCWDVCGYYWLGHAVGACQRRLLALLAEATRVAARRHAKPLCGVAGSEMDGMIGNQCGHLTPLPSQTISCFGLKF
jgi:hypothetical protein